MLSADAVARFIRSRESGDRRPRTIDFYTRELARLTKAYTELPEDADDLRILLNAPRGRKGDDGQVIVDKKGKPVYPVKSATKHATYRALRALYGFLHDEGLLTSSNPMRKIDAPSLGRTRQRTLDPRDVARLFELDSLSIRDRTIITLILDCGLRSGEVRALRGSDLRDDWIQVPDGKTGERVVPVFEETMGALRLLAGSQPEQLVFRTITGEPLTKDRLYKIVRRALKLLGFDASGKCGPHTLRHTFARGWIASGGELPQLMKMLGHKNITTTAVYIDLSPEEVAAAHKEFSRLTRAPAARLRAVK